MTSVLTGVIAETGADCSLAVVMPPDWFSPLMLAAGLAAPLASTALLLMGSLGLALPLDAISIVSLVFT